MVNGYKCFGTIKLDLCAILCLTEKMLNNTDGPYTVKTNLFAIGELFNDCYKILTKA